jgi:hypothetical protein
MKRWTAGRHRLCSWKCITEWVFSTIRVLSSVAGLYNGYMKTAKISPKLDRLLGPLGECLTPESARRLLALKADPELQAHVDSLATRHSEGLLTPEEIAEYGNYVTYGTFIAILKSKARQLLAHSQGD